MPYVVDIGENHLREAEDIEHALDIARLALESADYFARRKGWSPFWADSVCIVQCRAVVWREYWRDYAAVKSRGRIVLTAEGVRKRLGMPPAAPRPAFPSPPRL